VADEAQALGWRTLLIDADLTEHGITSGLDLASHPGLTDLLGDSSGANAVALSDDDPVVLGVGTVVKHRNEPVSAGSASSRAGGSTGAKPADLDSLLKRFLEDFDLVVIDSGGMAPNSDAVWSAVHADIVVLAVAERRDTRPDVVAAYDKLTDLGIDVSTMILTRSEVNGLADRRA
jgi:Mrp family chromosome partitioning ATPase